MKFDAIFFDLFNTVLHFDYSVLPEVLHNGKPLRTTSVEMHRSMQREFGLNCDFDGFLEVVMQSRREIVRMRGAEHRELHSLQRFQIVADRLGLTEAGAAERLVEVHMEQMFRMMHLPEENLQVLRKLRGRRLVLASNFDHAPTARRALRKYGIEDAFTHVFISDEVGWRKPGENFFNFILSGSGTVASECVFVGDDPVDDVWGASRAGFHVAWLARDSVEKLPAEPHWRLGSLPDLLDVVSARE